jgi:histidyl-tRNA synthetase
VIFNPEKKSLKSQLRQADKVKAKYVLILGEDEITQGKVFLKDMESGDQQGIEFENLINKVKSLVK